MYIPTPPSSLLFALSMGYGGNYLISFPFKFSVLKSSSASVIDFRNLEAIST